jgi:hypothetical protein
MATASHFGRLALPMPQARWARLAGLSARHPIPVPKIQAEPSSGYARRSALSYRLVGRVGNMTWSEEPRAPRTHEGRAAWITAFGTILLVVLGYLLLAGAVHLWPFATASSSATGPPSSSSPASTGQTNGQTAGSPSVSRWWHGPITIGQTGVELDARPPTTSGSSNTFFEIAGYLHPGNGQIAEWTGSSAPTPAQCHDWALSNSVQQLPLTSGMQLCVLTASQRIAYVKITSVSPDGNSAMATAIVWNI